LLTVNDIRSLEDSSVAGAFDPCHVTVQAKRTPAVIGISFHDGALVTNYPWDGEPDIPSGKYAASPDDALFINMGLFAKLYNHLKVLAPMIS
jgi:hypothetical protein